MTETPLIRFYGGIGTIGGTRVIVQEGEHRVLFDFGLTHGAGGDFWSHGVHPRPGATRLCDLIALGDLPAVDGIYRGDAAAAAGLTPGSGEKTQVFISHLHLDHMAAADLLAPDLPVWMHEESLRLFRAVAETGEEPRVPAGARAFRWGEQIQVGPIRVSPVPVDHDIAGACGLLVETSAGTVAYSGDLRWHGAEPERITAFIEAARRIGADLLLLEGTRVGEVTAPFRDQPPALTEPEVAERIFALLQECRALALITLYPRNISRLTAVAQAAAAAGRQLVLSPEAAHTYAGVTGGLEGIAVHLRLKDRLTLQGQEAPSWLRQLQESGAALVPSSAIGAEQGRYLLQLSHRDLPELVDMDPAEGSLFIHSNGEPLDRFDPAYETLTRWLERFGIPLVPVRSTGHASPDDLVRIASAIGPKVLMPVHSRRPELMVVPGVRRVLPELGAAYAVATGERLA